ncbi:hypothetical protein KQX54_001314 [Cotesia glomerata]|uniref:Uncharacterized protein n=1 Tax=Cotesia glomerata TaxID=32391 RepID=A0AAV7IZ20_COTGL|nr:hypothetical protein KQX54_001314 [Cotesia glomerata]
MPRQTYALIKWKDSAKQSTSEKKFQQISGQLSPKQVSDHKSRSSSRERKSRKDKHGGSDRRRSRNQDHHKKHNEDDKRRNKGSTPSLEPEVPGRWLDFDNSVAGSSGILSKSRSLQDSKERVNKIEKTNETGRRPPGTTGLPKQPTTNPGPVPSGEVHYVRPVTINGVYRYKHSSDSDSLNQHKTDFNFLLRWKLVAQKVELL